MAGIDEGDSPSVRPQPGPDDDSQGYWQHLIDGDLALQRCSSCSRWQFPALERCRYCNGELRYEAVSGSGSIHTFIVQHHKVAPGFEQERPYVIALVTPDEAPEARVPARIIGCSPRDVTIGARVTAELVEHPGGSYRVAVFRLAR